MWKFVLMASLCVAVLAKKQPSRPNLACTGIPHYNVSLTAYFPDYSSDRESDYLDRKGKKLRSLQDFIDDRSEFVTVAMDLNPKLKYGTPVCVPELNEHFGRMIPLQVRDYGVNLKGEGLTRLDVCVRTEADSYDTAVNREVTLYTKD